MNICLNFWLKFLKSENYYFSVQHQEILLTSKHIIFLSRSIDHQEILLIDFKAHIFLLISINHQFPHALEAAKQLKTNIFK